MKQLKSTTQLAAVLAELGELEDPAFCWKD